MSDNGSDNVELRWEEKMECFTGDSRYAVLLNHTREAAIYASMKYTGWKNDEMQSMFKTMGWNYVHDDWSLSTGGDCHFDYEKWIPVDLEGFSVYYCERSGKLTLEGYIGEKPHETDDDAGNSHDDSDSNSYDDSGIESD